MVYKITQLPASKHITRSLQGLRGHLQYECLMCGSRLVSNKQHGQTGQQTTQSLCEYCYEDLPLNIYCCQRCALPMPANIALCGNCQKELPTFDQALAPLRYEGAAKHWIRRIKHQADIATIQTSVDLLCDAISNQHHQPHQSQPSPVDAIVPVPMYWRKNLKRGNNQAHLLANAVATRLQLNFHPNLIVQTREKPEQKGLSRHERQNLKGVFAIRNPVKAKHIALVDDVITTGSTMNTLAAICKAAGAKEVSAWALTRTPKPR
ncbi:Orotate phosphoribosyltransferase [BD1-7 clade bacterium]|uniref:Orotate phosphoribosyltransferase n=1 Tax=BD1-7 clade bacterium TaxID=2029982 RepID=A0A5S9N762_9GAMM|nr:Orotate phosphoribosyltransferase [BD1-7 clade bacterium]